MLTHPTHERLITLGLTGMAKAFEEQRRSPDLDALPFEERIGLLVDREAAERDTKRLTTRLKFAALRQSACVEDVDLRTPRGIDRSVFARLVGGDWIDRNENLLITGATGLGKSWIACALGHKACRDNRSVQYHRVPRLFEALALARGDGRYGRLLKTISRVQLLILDDWGLAVLSPPERRDLLEILDDRHGRASTIVTSQIPVEHWHDVIGDPTLGDAILDRLVHNAHRLQLSGESMRKQNARLATNAGDDSYGEATPVRVVRNAGAERELAMMRWGMPPPPTFGGPPVTNIRNTSSPHWRGWLRPENRCLVPANRY
jgi:DNA replication protein DnaC